MIGSQLVMNLQQIVSRRVDPIESAVLSVGSFVSDNAFNVIADEAVLGGTVRTFSNEVRNLMEQELKRVAEGTAIANDCEITVEYFRGYPAVINHEKETNYLKSVAQSIPDLKGVEEMQPQMGGEDFAYYLEKVPGTFFFTGAKPTDPYPHHHPRFDIDEKAMMAAAKTLGAAAIDYQN